MEKRALGTLYTSTVDLLYTYMYCSGHKQATADVRLVDERGATKSSTLWSKPAEVCTAGRIAPDCSRVSGRFTLLNVDARGHAARLLVELPRLGSLEGAVP